MKPNEFWNCRYSDISIYCQSHLAKNIDILKQDINLQEAVTNKLIRADSMNRNPKIIPIRDSFKEIFKEEKRMQTPKEIARIMRGVMNSEK